MIQIQLDHASIVHGLDLDPRPQYDMPLLIVDFHQVRFVQSPLVFRIS